MVICSKERKRTGCSGVRIAEWLLAAKERKRTGCTGVRMAECLLAVKERMLVFHYDVAATQFLNMVVDSPFVVNV